MADSQPLRRPHEPTVPATSDGTVPYSDPLPTADADAAAPDGAPRPTRPARLEEKESGSDSPESQNG